MIQVVSNKFKVASKDRYTLKWFIECVCGFVLYEEEDNTYYFQGTNQGYLTTVAIELEEVEELSIPFFKLEEEGLIEVKFDLYIQTLLTSDLIYWEINTESTEEENCVTIVGTDNKIKTQRLLLDD